QLPRRRPGFARLYPDLHIDRIPGLSCNLLEAYDGNRLDAVIVKRGGAGGRGRVIWREPLVWLAAADYQLDFTRPARLVMLAPPCSYREMMIAALDSVRRDWVAACTASSLMGVQAAVAGGLGVTLLGRSFVQEGMQILRAPELWPALPMTEVTVLGEDRAPALVEPLIMFLSHSLAGHDALTIAA
ncbi:LysR family transcriptional regulator, partial [Methylobacterium variabile]